MGIQLSIASHISNVATAQASLIWIVSVKFRVREQLQHVRPAMGTTQHGTAAAQSEESNGKEHVRHMPTDHAGSTVNH